MIYVCLTGAVRSVLWWCPRMIVGVRLAMGGRVHGVVHGRRGAAGEPMLMPDIDR